MFPEAYLGFRCLFSSISFLQKREVSSIFFFLNETRSLWLFPYSLSFIDSNWHHNFLLVHILIPQAFWWFAVKKTPDTSIHRRFMSWSYSSKIHSLIEHLLYIFSVQSYVLWAQLNRSLLAYNLTCKWSGISKLPPSVHSKPDTVFVSAHVHLSRLPVSLQISPSGGRNMLM